MTTDIAGNGEELVAAADGGNRLETDHTEGAVFPPVEVAANVAKSGLTSRHCARHWISSQVLRALMNSSNAGGANGGDR